MAETEIKKEKIKISVRELVEFIFRSGDIDDRAGKGAQKDAMQEGSRMHRKIQKSMGDGYHAEVSLRTEIDMERYILAVEGRADGIMAGEKGVVIDEIKCMYTDVTLFENVIPVHRSQAICYGYIYAHEHGLEKIGIQITYCDLETEAIRRFSETLDIKTLDDWFGDLIARYKKWTDFRYDWLITRNMAIKGLKFPFTYRKGQRKLAIDVYRTISRKKTLFIQAPTGTGKTMAVVYPAVMALGEGLADKIFYLTAKTITCTVAKDAFDRLKEDGYRGKVTVITAKEKMCFCDEMKCDPESCHYAKGHYDRVNDAVYDIITSGDDFTREALHIWAEKYGVCPFELSLDVSVWSDVIICDYNYLFDPNVYLKRFFSDGIKGDYIFLVDEAHNLVERGRDMYSATLVKEDFLRIKKLTAGYDKKLEASLNKCNRNMLELKRGCEGYAVYDSIAGLVFSLMQLMSSMDAFLREKGEVTKSQEISEFYLGLRHFMNMYDRMDSRYVIYGDFSEDSEFILHLFCVDPSENLQKCLDMGNSAIFFSATLLPINYYKRMLCADKDNYAIYAEPLFDRKQRMLFVARDVSALYKRRTPDEFYRIASYICTVIEAKAGNYMVFFPSYRFMEDVYGHFVLMDGNETKCLLQSPGMNEEERERFISEFQNESDRSLVGFCVLGGIFSEGIDLRRESLIGAMIVGTGLPQICNEREVIKDYYHEREDKGFEYAYLYPGMNKVLQAAGRVIRTADDVGVIGLLDERFLRRDYLKLFPVEWDDYKVYTLKNLPGALADFWDDMDHSGGI